jgi:hypothetical protein
VAELLHHHSETAWGREERVHDCRETGSSLFEVESGRGVGILEIIVMNISNILEALFDAIEYRLARHALRQARRIRAKRRPRSKLIIDEGIPT